MTIIKLPSESHCLLNEEANHKDRMSFVKTFYRCSDELELQLIKSETRADSSKLIGDHTLSDM